MAISYSNTYGPKFEVGDVITWVNAKPFWPRRLPNTFIIHAVINNDPLMCACGKKHSYKKKASRHRGPIPNQWLIVASLDGDIILRGWFGDKTKPTMFASDWFVKCKPKNGGVG
ncbi:MAG: hypothetical protein ABH822_01120 [Patescibacteria group bacterium]